MVPAFVFYPAWPTVSAATGYRRAGSAGFHSYRRIEHVSAPAGGARFHMLPPDRTRFIGAGLRASKLRWVDRPT